MMKHASRSAADVPFPLADHRFDQKNEMFKRAAWDEEMQPLGRRFYGEAVFQDRPGYRKTDYALRNASWKLEWSVALGNSLSNHGLYNWEGVPEKIRHWVEEGGPVRESPERMSRRIKQAARLFGADLVGITRLHPNWVYAREYNRMDCTNCVRVCPFNKPRGILHDAVCALIKRTPALNRSKTISEHAAVGKASHVNPCLIHIELISNVFNNVDQKPNVIEVVSGGLSTTVAGVPVFEMTEYPVSTRRIGLFQQAS